MHANRCPDSGALSEHELGTALVNGDYTVFDPHTVKMMIRWEKRYAVLLGVLVADNL